jgi:hypothetical protein
MANQLRRVGPRQQDGSGLAGGRNDAPTNEEWKDVMNKQTKLKNDGSRACGAQWRGHGR